MMTTTNFDDVWRHVFNFFNLNLFFVSISSSQYDTKVTAPIFPSEEVVRQQDQTPSKRQVVLKRKLA